MNWSVALRLGRVSNLPTVTSNVLAGIALVGAHPPIAHIVIVCVAMSMMYVAGMYLNDAFDREIDAVERPERPIPAGLVTARTVFDIGFALLGGGLALVTALALLTGTGWSAVLSMTALGSLIVLYDSNHKLNPLSPVIMGLCRAAVYITAALAVSRDLSPGVLVGAGCLVAYLIGLTYIARQENLRSMSSWWPVAFLAVPFLVALPHGLTQTVLYVGFVVWVLRSLALLRARNIREAVTSLIAGISLLDAIFILREGRPGLAGIAIAAWLLTKALQRYVPGT
jgi:4-hydroxybenzoate polyprenyltransferase